jgi:hypothetical protein
LPTYYPCTKRIKQKLGTIRRLQPGYKGLVRALHSSKDTNDKPKIRYCSRCEGLGVYVRLGPRILEIGQPKPADHDHWLQCHNCGQIYAKHETRIEAEIGPIKSSEPKGKIKVEKKPKRKGRGSITRLSSTRNKWEIKDEELNAELKHGSVLLAYSSNDPTEPVV